MPLRASRHKPMRSAKAKSSKVILLACALLFASWLCRGYWRSLHGRTPYGWIHGASFPKKIWQISHFPPGQEPAFIDEYRMRWAQTHPNYQYECFNESTEDAFVQKAFSNYRDIRQTYNFIKQDPILRADFLRYLILLAEGGVYTDVDTQPIRPIEDWVHPEFLNRTNVVLGIEADQALGPVWRGAPWTVQMAQFTIMSKPNHPLLLSVVESVQENVRLLLKQRGAENALSRLSFDDVIGLTGPRVFNSAVYQYLSEELGFTLNGNEITGLKDPILLADVLIHPVNAFASGQQHSQSGTSSDRTALVSHTWMSSWVPTHPHQPSEYP